MHISAKLLLVAGMASTILGCASHRALKPAKTMGGQIDGQGFAASFPQTTGWYVVKSTHDETVFLKASEETAQRSPADAVITASLGVRTLPAEELARQSDSDFAAGVERFLAKRMGGPPAFYAGSSLLALEQLDTEPHRFHDAVCAKYEALQIARNGAQLREPELAFSDHGIVCRHPDDPGRLIQMFFNERSVRVMPRFARPATWDEVTKAFESLRFTPDR
ncbi:hypothetical protein [Methylocaldum szegediense]|uniref:hypothetical protein n=1 Tax=Methylocaldum szegediense TaxID=73780 RepID=UPI0003FAFA06|nr:hypothetical protein [Methylocaldum szegediense]